MKTQNLTGAALDWAVAKAAGYSLNTLDLLYDIKCYSKFKPSTDWAQGGPIIECEGITVAFCSGDLGEPRSYWIATSEQWSWEFGYGPYHHQDDEKSIQIYKHAIHTGPTPLIAAMRCYCCSKLGDIVDVPEELCQSQSS